MLYTPLGAGRLCARAGDCRLWLLDAPATVLWDLHHRGLSAAALAALVAERFGLAAATVRDQVDRQLQQWRQAGLLAAAVAAPRPRVDDPVIAEPTPQPLAGGAWRLRVADRAVGLGVEDAALRRRLQPWLSPSGPEDNAGLVDHHLRLSGAIDAWRLRRDGQPVAAGQTLDAALLAVLAALTGLACRPAERLLVVHGAGVVTPAGRGLLLVAPGGSGKTTLAAALNAEGWPLLHDDVVPVARDGGLLGLGLPMALKAGSWPILASRRPDLDAWPLTQRFDQPVRLLPLRGPAPGEPVPLGAFVFPRYCPDAPPQRAQLTSEQALQRLVAAETVIRSLTQAKLERLARWVESVPAWSLTYPALDHGLAGVRALLAETPGA